MLLNLLFPGEQWSLGSSGPDAEVWKMLPLDSGQSCCLVCLCVHRASAAEGLRQHIRLELTDRLKRLFIQHVVTECLLHVLRARSREGKVKVKVTQSCLTLCDPMDCSPPVSSVRGILQARILEWVAISFSRGIFPTQGSNPGLLHCRHTLYHLSHQGVTEGKDRHNSCLGGVNSGKADANHCSAL